MASPEPSPLQRYLRVQTQVDREMAAILRDAAQEADRVITRLGEKAGLGATVRRAQIAVMQRELRQQQAALWGGITKATQAGMAKAAQAAVAGEQVIDATLFNALGIRLPALEEAMKFQAANVVDNLYAKASNGIPLSEQVYRSQQLADGAVTRQINRAIALGYSATELATSVRSMIRPDVPGGVSYAAMRLGRTEINNAFHTAQIERRVEEPWTTGMKWHLSGSHPKPDACNDYADSSHFKGGAKGVFKPDQVPAKPHPNCLCYLTTEVVSPDEFVSSFLRGDYSDYIDRKIYTHLPNPVC